MAETPITAWSTAIGAPVIVASATFALGTKFTPVVGGLITGVGCRRPTAGTFTVKVWNATTGTLLGSAAVTVPGGPGWTYVALGTPIPAIAGTAYVVSTYASSKNYYRHTPVTYPRTQGTFSIVQAQYDGADVYPTTAHTTSFFPMADIQFAAPEELGGSWGVLEMA